MYNVCPICENSLKTIYKLQSIPFLSTELYAFCSEECYKIATEVNSIMMTKYMADVNNHPQITDLEVA